MNPSSQEKEIFGQAVELTAPGERAAFVNSACGADASLRERVWNLLAAAAAPTGFLRDPPNSPAMEEAGRMIGPYRLLKRIGEGGFGVVFLAEQTAPVRRRVALKIIKPGMDSRQVIARFEAERQALAMMDHPHIAKILDAGVTGHSPLVTHHSPLPQGRPYFVMELVEGVPITAYCRDHQLDRPSRLGLFIDVCSAVQHAHQKGVIHRDLKPSNILVAALDGKPTPKVIDFGIAKATHEPLTDQTVLTHFQQFLGTPAYMSPEQAALSGGDLDTRSDIYSLGVLLYELLTGVTPFDTKELVASGIDGMRKTILEKEPIRPSARLNQLQARTRDSKPITHHSSLATDLDLIVMKALEKDRDRRYATANGLALDLRRFLNHEPVSAVAPTLSYQLAKFYRRHRKVVVTAGAFLLLLLAASLISVTMAIRARRAEAVAIREAAAAYNVSEFMWKEILKQLTPWHHTNSSVTLREAFELAATGIDARLGGQPLAEASVRYTFGKTYTGLGEWNSAETNLVRAITLRREHAGPLDARTAEAMYQLGTLRAFQGRWSDAEALYEEVAFIRAQTLGLNHRDTVSAAAKAALARANRLPDSEAEALLERTLERTRQFVAPDHYTTRATIRELGIRRRERGQIEDAYALFKESHRLSVLEEGPLSNDALTDLALMGSARARQSHWDEAERLFQEAIAARVRISGPNHPFTHSARLDYANEVLIRQKRFNEAAAIILEVAASVKTGLDANAAAIVRRVAGQLHKTWKQQGGGREADAFEQNLKGFLPGKAFDSPDLPSAPELELN